MLKNQYTLDNTADLISPALIYYKDIILDNTKKAISMAGDPQRLWPHVKSHKCAKMVRMQIELGITRFKCATIAEAEMTAAAGGAHIILAYPLVGPNIARFLKLAKYYPQTIFYAIGDNYETLSELAAAAAGMKMSMNVLIDVDLGMHRTGVSFDSLLLLYECLSGLDGISIQGLHCYDGHCHEKDFNSRKQIVDENDSKVARIRELLRQKNLPCKILVMGGTPTFPCRTGKPDFYLSPGTLFINDWGYYSGFPDLDFIPGAAVFTRVVSHQGGNTFTLDLGHKGIGADPQGARGIIAGFEEAKPLFQSEEHWVFSLPAGSSLPPIGSGQYVIPTHICPTSALYPEIQIAQAGKITEQWKVTARNRKINF
ncbi:MAG: D-TA family PLP-dependent enzyme [Treponema sp.]|nr:D-TA family PLP-dependent enzyme [Treponema sp.]